MFKNPADCSGGELVFSMILPLLLCAAVLVMLRFFRINAPVVLGAFGAALCLLLMIGTFFTGGTLRILLAVIFYLLAAALLAGTAAGFVPTRQFSVILLCAIFLVRILFFRPGLDLFAWTKEVSDLAILVAVILLPGTLRPLRKKNA